MTTDMPPSVAVAAKSPGTGTDEERSFLQDRLRLAWGWMFLFTFGFYTLNAAASAMFGLPYLLVVRPIVTTDAEVTEVGTNQHVLLDTPQYMAPPTLAIDLRNRI